MLEIQKKLHKNVLVNIQKSQSNQKWQYEAKHNTYTKLKIGDNVLIESKKMKVGRGENSRLLLKVFCIPLLKTLERDNFILIMPKAKF